MTQHTLMREAFPDFILDIDLPEGFIDSSWVNEPCPSFINQELDLILYVDYADPAQREHPETTRFSLLETVNGVYAVERPDDHYVDTDSLEEVISAIETVKAQIQALEPRAEQLTDGFYYLAQSMLGQGDGGIAGEHESGNRVRDGLATPMLWSLRRADQKQIDKNVASLRNAVDKKTFHLSDPDLDQKITAEFFLRMKADLPPEQQALVDHYSDVVKKEVSDYVKVERAFSQIDDVTPGY